MRTPLLIIGALFLAAFLFASCSSEATPEPAEVDEAPAAICCNGNCPTPAGYCCSDGTCGGNHEELPIHKADG